MFFGKRLSSMWQFIVIADMDIKKRERKRTYIFSKRTKTYQSGRKTDTA